MKRKDLFLGVILCVPMLGLGHFYAGDKQRGMILLGVQLLLQLLAGIAMFFSSLMPTLIYMVYIGVGIWALYDTVQTIKLVNSNISN